MKETPTNNIDKKNPTTIYDLKKKTLKNMDSMGAEYEAENETEIVALNLLENALDFTEEQNDKTKSLLEKLKNLRLEQEEEEKKKKLFLAHLHNMIQELSIFEKFLNRTTVSLKQKSDELFGEEKTRNMVNKYKNINYFDELSSFDIEESEFFSIFLSTEEAKTCAFLMLFCSYVNEESLENFQKKAAIVEFFGNAYDETPSGILSYVEHSKFLIIKYYYRLLKKENYYSLGLTQRIIGLADSFLFDEDLPRDTLRTKQYREIVERIFIDALVILSYIYAHNAQKKESLTELQVAAAYNYKKTRRKLKKSLRRFLQRSPNFVLFDKQVEDLTRIYFFCWEGEKKSSLVFNKKNREAIVWSLNNEVDKFVTLLCGKEKSESYRDSIKNIVEKIVQPLKNEASKL